MIRPTTPRVVVGDRVQVRADARDVHGVSMRGAIGDVINLPFGQNGLLPQQICVLVRFAGEVDLIMFPLSELSVIPNLEARRGEVA